jgi:Ni/Co efflux regulator RcnB
MTNFPDKLRLKAMAEEDIYFAKRDRKLIRAMHERKLAQHLKIDKNNEKKKAERLEDKYAIVRAEHWCDPRKLQKRYRNLIDKALKLVKRK